jgi:hypothetical protein
MSAKASLWAKEQPLTGRKKQLPLAIAHAVDETGACRALTQDALGSKIGCKGSSPSRDRPQPYRMRDRLRSVTDP